MRNKKIVLLLIVGLLFISLCNCVNAEETRTINDPEDDVITADFSDANSGDLTDLDTTDQKPNIDIVKLTYIHEDLSQEATVKLEVNSRGHIEDKGSIADDMEDIDDLFQPIVLYGITLETSTSYYEMLYINGTCSVNDDSETISFDVDDSVLTITFNLNDADETFYSLIAESSEMDFSSLTSAAYYIDVAPNEILEVTAEAVPESAEVGESIQFFGEADLGNSDYLWTWDFGDGSISEEQNPDHEYDTPGTYDVQLYVNDTDYNFGSTTLSVTITEDGSSNNNNNGGSSSSSNNMLLFIGIIVIICIVGIAVVVYIIRK